MREITRMREILVAHVKYRIRQITCIREIFVAYVKFVDTRIRQISCIREISSIRKKLAYADRK